MYTILVNLRSKKKYFPFQKRHTIVVILIITMALAMQQTTRVESYEKESGIHGMSSKMFKTLNNL